MLKRGKNIILSILILETALIVFLGIKNFQKAKENLNLELEIKSRLDGLSNKEAQIKEWEVKLGEQKGICLDLEAKVKDLTEIRKVLGAKIGGVKVTTEILTKQADPQRKDIFKQFRDLTEEDRKTFILLLNKLEDGLKRLKSGEESSIQEVDLAKITVRTKENLESLEYLGSILEVDDRYNFVIIDLGQEDNVKPGMKFSVFRDKKKIGEIVLKEVYKGTSLAEAIVEKTDIGLRQGDKLIPLK